MYGAKQASHRVRVSRTGVRREVRNRVGGGVLSRFGS